MGYIDPALVSSRYLNSNFAAISVRRVVRGSGFFHQLQISGLWLMEETRPLRFLPEFFDAHNISDDTELKNSVVEKLLKKHGARTINRNLKDEGIYIFDIFNLEALTDGVVSNFSTHLHKKIGDTQLHSVQCSTIDRKNGFLTSYDHHILQKKTEKPIRINNKFSLQIYSAKDLRG